MNHLAMPTIGGQVNRCRSEQASCIDVGTLFNQKLDNIQVTIGCRYPKWSNTIHREIDQSTVPNQCNNNIDMSR